MTNRTFPISHGFTRAFRAGSMPTLGLYRVLCETKTCWLLLSATGHTLLLVLRIIEHTEDKS